MKKKETRPPLLPNRLAPGAKLLSPDDDSHVIRQSPLDLKKRELEEARQLQDSDERAQSEATANARNFGKVKPSKASRFEPPEAQLFFPGHVQNGKSGS